MRAAVLAALLVATTLVALAPTASAAPCTGAVVDGKLTGYCLNDPACPSQTGGYTTGYYVNGIRVACNAN